MSVSINEYHPTTMTHPGVPLRDKLEEIGKSPESFAQEISADEAVILDIVNEKGSITQDLAEAFEKALKIPTHFWMRGQQMYDECLANQTESEIQEPKRLFELLKIDDATFDLLNGLLHSEAFSSKEDTMKVVRAIDQLKMRQEMLELLQSDNIEEALKELKETAERFAKKTKHPVGNLDAI